MQNSKKVCSHANRARPRHSASHSMHSTFNLHPSGLQFNHTRMHTEFKKCTDTFLELAPGYKLATQCSALCYYRTGSKHWISSSELLVLLGTFSMCRGTLPIIGDVQYLEPVRYQAYTLAMMSHPDRNIIHSHTCRVQKSAATLLELVPGIQLATQCVAFCRY